MAAEAAKLDGGTRPQIARMQGELAAAKSARKAERDPLRRLQLKGAIAHYESALSTLRAGPFGDSQGVDNVAAQ